MGEALQAEGGIAGSGDDWNAFALARCEPLTRLDGAYVAPDLPPKVVAGALRGYLQLRPDELLLAVVDRSRGRRARYGCALTTRRFCWWNPPSWRRAARGDGAQGPAGPEPRGGRSIAYADLPAEIRAVGALGPTTIDLGGRVRVRLGGQEPGTAAALAEFLRVVGEAARSGGPASLAPGLDERMRGALPEVAQATEAALAVQAEIRGFEAELKSATPRVVVTYLVAAACVAVFAMMVLSGVSPSIPTVPQLDAWGASRRPGCSWRGSGGG